MTRKIACLGTLAIVTTAAWGQTAANPARFEVALIKLADPLAHGSSLTLNPGAGLTVRNLPLKDIISFAWDVRESHVSGGPGWVASEPYDITAKTDTSQDPAAALNPAKMTGEQIDILLRQTRERLRTLLAERFGLVAHLETRDEPVYLLVVDKNGPKLELVAQPGGRQGMNAGKGRYEGIAASMAVFATTLAGVAGRPVLDKTGLPGKYNFVLEWTPGIEAASPGDTDEARAADMPGPSIFSAIREQLGLRLEPSRGPVDNVVIERVDRPSGN